MNNMTVGMENLPNVFIDRIFVFKNENSTYKIEVTLCMYDHGPHQSDRSWHKRINDLNVKIAFVRSNLQKLNNGELSLYDYPVTSSPTIQVVSAGDFELLEEFESSLYDKFIKVVEIDSVSQPTNMNVYAASFIGDLDLGNDLLNKFYGPMSAEKIFTGGTVSERSGYFYYPDTNEEYAGPVHGHEGGFMVGSLHSDTPHKTVVYVEEENFKLTSSEYVDPNSLNDREEPGPQSAAGNKEREQTEAERQRRLDDAIESNEDNIPTGPLDELQEYPE